jgi:hypothetical protein
MRVPVQAPALMRDHRAGVARWSGGVRTNGYGVSPSQYEGGGEGAEDESGENGDEGGNETESAVESE